MPSKERLHGCIVVYCDDKASVHAVIREKINLGEGRMWTGDELRICLLVMNGYVHLYPCKTDNILICISSGLLAQRYVHIYSRRICFQKQKSAFCITYTAYFRTFPTLLWKSEFVMRSQHTIKICINISCYLKNQGR